MNFDIIMTVGIYARNDTNELIKEMRTYITSIIKEYPLVKQLHGFYLDEGNRTVSFDLIFDFENKETDREVDEIKAKLKEKYPEYEFYIVIDKDFSD